MKLKFNSIVALFAILSACQIGRSVVHQTPGMNDYKIFPNRDLHANNRAFIFPKGRPMKAQIPEALNIQGKEVPFEKFLKENNTVGFLIIQNDTVLFEKYFEGYDSSSIVPSFSMANCYTSALIGCAIEDGLIGSVDDAVINYIPELKKNGFEKVTIKHLLQMTSGLDFSETSSDPLAEAATFYYGKNLEHNTLHLTLKREPGKVFDFTSGSTQILGLILQRVLKNENITHYFERRIWFPIETEFDGSWSIDKNDGMEKTFCCINARARDYAKFGRLYLKNGNWNGKQIVPGKWVKESLTPDATNGGVNYFKYQWWLYENDADHAFYAEGNLGQFIYVNPNKNLIIIRLGTAQGKVNWKEFFAKYAATVE